MKDIYFAEVLQIPRLSCEQELALAETIALGCEANKELTGLAANFEAGIISLQEYAERHQECMRKQAEGADAKQRIVLAHLYLVVGIAKKYVGRGLSLLDLIQEGNIGLMEAANRFDPSRGFKFSTYAVWWIRQAITRAISDQSRTIRLPVHVIEQVTKLRRTAHELQQALLREPTEEELGQALNMSDDRIREVLHMACQPASLDAPMGEGEDSSLGDFLEDEHTGAPGAEISVKEQVEDILSKLTERERQILQMRFGLTDDRPRTLGEVAREFGITRQRISRLEKNAMCRLRGAPIQAQFR